MSPTLEIDCRAQQCPVPVLRLAKAAGQVGNGGHILIRADDPAFPKDLHAWARSARSRVTRLDDLGDYYEAEIHVGDEPSEVAAAHRPGSSRSDLRVSQTFDLCGHPRTGLFDIIQTACERAEPGAVLAILVDDPEFELRLDAWLATVDATCLGLERRGPVTEARLRVEPAIPPEARTALDPPMSIPSSLSARELRTPISSASSASQVAVAQPPERERCTLLVLHNDHEALLAALLIANGAAAQGMETCVFFTFWGLNLLRGARPNLAEPKRKVGILQRLMKWMMPKGPRRQPLGQMHFAGLGKGMLSSIMRRQQLMGLPELIDSAQQLGVRFTACTMSMSVMGIAPRDLHPYSNLDYGGVASFVEDARGSAVSLVF